MNKPSRPCPWSFLFALLASCAGPLAAATDADELKALREQLRALEQKILALEQKQAARESTPPAAAPSVAKVTVNDRGVTLASADGANAVRVRGLVQADARQFFADDGAGRDALVLRRARLITEGVFARNFSVQLVAEFGGTGSPTILDANLNVALAKGLGVRVGKFKPPVGLEQLQSDSWTFFNERSIATNLAPGRDLGIMAWGELADGRVGYSAGIFNGVADGASSTNTDIDNDKDVAGRLWFSPFKAVEDSPWQGLSFGVGGSTGRHKTAVGRPQGFRTDGQQTFLAYLPGVVADGRAWRISPQFDYRHGPFGLLGEYVLSAINVRPAAGAPIAELKNRAWQLAAGYVLTGEDSSPNGVVPRSDLRLADGRWGAIEVAARIAGLQADEAAFPLFASPAGNVAGATSIGVGFNWYLSKAASVKFDYYQTEFDAPPGSTGSSTTPFLRQDERVLITRFQLGF